MKVGKSVLFLVATAVAALISAHPDLFALKRGGISSGEVWRLFTGHFVHFSTQHFVANVATLALLLSLSPALSQWRIVWLGLLTPFLLGAWLYFARPGVAIYGGFSGWLSALFVFVVWEHSRGRHWARHFYRLGLALFVTKVLIESGAGTSLFADLGQGVVVESSAHAFGAGIAVLGLLLDPQCWLRSEELKKLKGGPRRNRLTFFGAALHRPQINSLKAIRRNDRYPSVTSNNKSV